MKTLTYNQNIRIAAWADDASARVFTVRGYALANGRHPDAAEMHAKDRGHEMAGTIYSSGALVGDRATAQRMLAERLAASAGATTLAQDEVVEIEGKPYRVRIARGNTGRYPTNCDPVHFIPVLDLEGIDDAHRDDADRAAMEAQCFPIRGEG